MNIQKGGKQKLDIGGLVKVYWLDVHILINTRYDGIENEKIFLSSS